jgi:DNA-binding winged helix-turn-helix (wHTH) protein/TolB-like protein/Flp pilus assembly protein TadD
MDSQIKHFYEFGPFRIDTSNRLLLRDGQPVPLKRKAVEVLLVLVKHKGEVLEKERLMETLWPDSFVEEANLTQSVYMLRKALGEQADGPRYIETIPRRGYRFAAEVKVWEDLGAMPVSVKTEQAQNGTEFDKTELVPTLLPAEPAKVGTRALLFLVLAASGLTLVCLAAYWWNHREPSVPGHSDRVRSIAVLPFKSLNPDAADDDYLGLGMADTLITRLGSVGQVIVRPTNSIRMYTLPGRDPLQAGRELGVESVLEGSIQRAGQRVRVTAQLLRVRDGKSLWADSFDEPLTDIFSMQDRVSERVISALALELTGSEQRLLVKRYTDNPEAYQAYLKGRYYWNKRTNEGFNRAIEFFNDAVKKDPAYALAYVGLADCYNMLGEYGMVLPGDSFPKARAAAAKALDLDEQLADAHNSLALVQLNYDWDFPAAEKEFKRALELNPNYATAHQWYAEYLMINGRFDESLVEMRRAQDLDPLSLIINTGVGYVFYHARRYDEAIEQLRRTVDMDNTFLPALSYLAMAYEQKGMHEEAIREYRKVTNLMGDLGLVGLAHAYAIAGKTDDARATLELIKKYSARNRVPPENLALIYTGLGDRELALTWLDNACKQRSSWMLHLKTDPRFDSLRSDPRFDAIVKCVYPRQAGA